MALLDADRELARDGLYAATSPRVDSFDALLGDAGTCDVAVVGGGLAGLSAAIELRQRGFDVALLEAARIGSGASGRNGGQALRGLACDPTTIEAQLGLDEARRIDAMTSEAVVLIRQRCAEFSIDCEWRGGALSVATSERKARQLRSDSDHLAQCYGRPTRWIERAALPQWIASRRYVAATHDPEAGHLNPLKYCRGLARAAAGLGVRLHERSVVTHCEETGAALLQLRTESGAVLRAGQVLLAGNVHLPLLAPALAAQIGSRVMPVGTYVVATEPMPAAEAQALIPCGAAVCDNNVVLDYFRVTADHRMLFGGGVSYSARTPTGLTASMGRRMLAVFPQLARRSIEHTWGGFVDISMNRAPDFGRLAGRPGRVYYLQGFSGHGVALTGLAGRLVAEAMAGDASRFDTFARLRHRPFPGGPAWRTPALVLGMAYYRLKDLF